MTSDKILVREIRQIERPALSQAVEGPHQWTSDLQHDPIPQDETDRMLVWSQTVRNHTPITHDSRYLLARMIKQIGR